MNMPNMNLGKRIIIGVVLINILAITLNNLALWHSFNNYQQQAQTNTQNLSEILAHDLDSTIGKVSVGLFAAKTEIERQLQVGHVDETIVKTYFSNLQAQLPGVIGIRATDQQGWVKYGVDVPTDRKVSNADRPHFLVHQQNPQHGLFIGHPLLSRINKVWVLNFSLRLNYPDGRFAGVVFANIPLDNFSNMFAIVNIGARGLINFRDGEMRLISRYPLTPDVLKMIGQQDIPREYRNLLTTGANQSGTFYSQDYADGIVRTVSYRKLGSYPLYVSVGLATEDYLAKWQQELTQMLILLLAFCIFSSASGWMLTRAWQKRLQAQQKLAQQEEKFHTIADFTHDWEYWESADHELLYVSPSCETITGYLAIEFITDPSLLTRVVHPDDQALLDCCRNHPLQDINEVDFRIVRRNGEIRWINHRCRPIIAANGSYMGQRVSNRDITDKRLFEAEINRLAQAVEQSPVGICIGDVTGSLLFTNQAYTRITGYNFAEAYNMSQRELISSSLSDEMFNDIQTKLSAGNAWYGIVPNTHKKGEARWEQLNISPIYDQQGSITNYLYLRIDITEQIHNEEALKRYQEHLEEEVQQRTQELMQARDAALEASKAKSTFLANMSHELRTPLNAILGFSDILRRDPSMNSTQQETLAIIHKSGDYLLGLINNILDIAKIEAGRIELENAPFDLGALVLDISEMLRIRAQEKGLSLAVDETSEFPRYIVGDQAKIKQILVNLISNAIKATEQGQITLRLSTLHNHAEHLIIEVEDTGCGISEADQQRIFEPFTQVGEVAKQQGTGLGLAITRQFVELMGGHINVSSKVGQGSIFRAEIIVALVEQENIPVTPTSAGDVIALAPEQNNYRVLIVEDKSDNQILLSRLLEGVGFQVQLADNGAQAIQQFTDWQPHFIWMDRRMPVMDGVEASKRIRALPGGEQVKIAAVTAATFKEEDAELNAAGFDDIVHKPYRAEQIFQCMGKLLGVRYLRKENKASDPPSIHELNPAELASLPPSFRANFKEVLASLDNEQILATIEQLEQSHPQLASALRNKAQLYDYAQIIKLL